MTRFLIIADDLTGAAEIGGIAHGHGLSAHIGQFKPTHSDALIINTDTRHLSPKEAAERLRAIFSKADPKIFEFIFKKTDSVLRGPVASELNALMPLLGFDRSLLVPQNPSRGRTIEDGDYKINGRLLHLVAPFATDPEHPATTADVRLLIGPSDVMNTFNASPGENISPTGITIGAGTKPAHLRHWASRLDPRTLAAGAADFFTAILQSKNLPPIPSTFSIAAGPSLTICGSASTYSRNFINLQPPHSLCPLPNPLFDPNTATDSAIDQWANEIRAHLTAHKKTLLTIPQPPTPSRAKHVRQVLAKVTARLLSQHPLKTLYIEGGATAAAITQQMNWTELDVIAQLAPGVVALRPTDSPTPHLILKPGSYPWPPALPPLQR